MATLQMLERIWSKLFFRARAFSRRAASRSRRPGSAVGASVLMAVAGQCLASGLADVTVFDRTEGRRAPLHWHEGRAYVAGTPGNEYQIAVRNRLGEDLLAVVSVDGVNVITGETASAAQSGYVLGPHRSLEIKGWRKSLERTAAFYFTALPDSYAARTGRPDDVGVIGVALFRRKAVAPPPAPIGPAEPRARDGDAGQRNDAPGSAKSSASGAAAEHDAQRLGTGHGRHEVSPARRVAFERATRDPAQVIAIQYDSRQNLLARGVIREPAPIAQCAIQGCAQCAIQGCAQCAIQDCASCANQACASCANQACAPCASRSPSCGPRPFPGFTPDPPTGIVTLPNCC